MARTHDHREVAHQYPCGCSLLITEKEHGFSLRQQFCFSLDCQSTKPWNNPLPSSPTDKTGPAGASPTLDHSYTQTTLTDGKNQDASTIDSAT